MPASRVETPTQAEIGACRRSERSPFPSGAVTGSHALGSYDGRAANVTLPMARLGAVAHNIRCRSWRAICPGIAVACVTGGTGAPRHDGIAGQRGFNRLNCGIARFRMMLVTGGSQRQCDGQCEQVRLVRLLRNGRVVGRCEAESLTGYVDDPRRICIGHDPSVVLSVQLDNSVKLRELVPGSCR